MGVFNVYAADREIATIHPGFKEFFLIRFRSTMISADFSDSFHPHTIGIPGMILSKARCADINKAPG
jgi:hypothetical protein